MDKNLKLLALDLYQTMEFNNNCYVFPKNTAFTEINWFISDKSQNSQKLVKNFGFLNGKDYIDRKSSINLLGKKTTDDEFQAFICEIYTLYQLLGRGGVISSHDIWKQVIDCNQPQCFSGVSPQFFDDVLKNIVNLDICNNKFTDYVNKPIKDEFYFNRRFISAFDVILVKPDDLLSVVYAVYAVYLHNVDYGKYPEIFLLPTNRDATRVAKNFINSQGITVTQCCLDTPEYLYSFKGQNLMILPQYKMAEYYRYHNDNLHFYVVNEPFENIYSSVPESTLIGWLDKYIHLYEEMLQSGKDVCSFTHFCKLTPDFVKEWLKNNNNFDRKAVFDIEAAEKYYLQSSYHLQNIFTFNY